MKRRFACCTDGFYSKLNSRLTADIPLEDMMRGIATAGYTGIEIAPVTLGPNPMIVPKVQIAAFRRAAEQAGLQIIAIHWILAFTEGLLLTSPDPRVRQRTAEYLIGLGRLVKELCDERVMVFGSPKQRSRLDGVSVEDGNRYAVDTFRRAMPTLEKMRVRIAKESLPTGETNFGNTMAEVDALADAVDSPNFDVHLDVKSLCAETNGDSAAMAGLIRTYGPKAYHFHGNDANRQGPGYGDVDFRPLLGALDATEYAGWVSVEAFVFDPDPVTCATRSLEYMMSCC